MTLKKTSKFDIQDVILLLGVLLIAIGLGMIFLPMAFIFVGAMLFYISLNMKKSE